MKNSTERFADRVENYIRYRPSYPVEVVDELQSWSRVTNGSKIADIGSGTGILTKLFLDRNFKVSGVEPNGPMREAAEKLLRGYTNFTSVNGTAERTTLDSHSVDLVVAGQAFHWFDQEKSQLEFERILRRGGQVGLVWNERKHDTSPFLRDYESLVEGYAQDYASVNHRNIGEDTILKFFGSKSLRTKSFQNNQRFDLEGLKGRCLSSSYMPVYGTDGHDALIQGLEELFRKHQEGGFVLFEYETNVYCGALTA